jgi:hypothetical protein
MRRQKLDMSRIRSGLCILGVLAILATECLGQNLDETWTVAVGGQSARVRANGSFIVANVSVADTFGPDGPGSPPDGLSDEILHVVGTRTAGSTTQYMLSEPFQLRRGQPYAIDGFTFSESPPVLPEALRIDAESTTLRVGESVALTVFGTLGDGSEVDVTRRGDGTVYRTSNPRVATVDRDGVVTAHDRGVVFITVLNLGATAVKRITSIRDTVRLRIAGFVQLPDGSPAAGASLRVAGGASAVAGPDGAFDFETEALIGVELALVVTVDAGGVRYSRTVRFQVDAEMTLIALGDVVLEPTADELFLHRVLGTGPFPTSVASADFDGDGDADLVVGNSGLDQGSNRVSVILNLGGGAFAVRVAYHSVESPAGIALGDFDGDGRTDIAAVGINVGAGAISLHRGRGDGTFVGPFFSGVGAQPLAITRGDLDGDGDLDLAVANSGSANVSVLLNRGDGMFAAHVTYAAGTTPRSIVAGDLDGDGDQDLAVANDGSASVSVLRNRGDGTFDPQVTFATGPRPVSIAQGDVDGDGDLDLVTSSFSSASVRLLVNNGDGSFAAATSIPARGQPFGVALGDVDGDRDLDLAVTDASTAGTVSVLLGRGDGTFALAVERAVGRAPEAVALGDVDGNGSADLLVASKPWVTLSLFYNPGDGSFPANASFAAGTTPGVGVTIPASVALSDIDADGLLDVLAANATNTVSTLRNLGDGSFAGPVAFAAGSSPFSVAAADLDGDDDADIVVVNLAANRVAVLLNGGDGTFPAPTLLTTGSQPASVAVGDLDRDGDPDLAVANYGAGANSVSLLLNQGDGTFAAQVQYPVGTRPRVVALGDLDGDGDADLAAAISGAVSIGINRGDGTFDAFVPSTAGGPAFFSFSLAFADFDGDGDLDIAATTGSGLDTTVVSFPAVALLRNQGDGTFAAREDIALQLEPYSLTTGDIDGDGSIDIIAANSGHTMSVLLNRGDAVFTPSYYGTGASQGGLAAGDIDGDGDLDVVVGGGGRATVFRNRRIR